MPDNLNLTDLLLALTDDRLVVTMRPGQYNCALIRTLALCARLGFTTDGTQTTMNSAQFPCSARTLVFHLARLRAIGAIKTTSKGRQGFTVTLVPVHDWNTLSPDDGSHLPKLPDPPASATAPDTVVGPESFFPAAAKPSRRTGPASQRDYTPELDLLATYPPLANKISVRWLSYIERTFHRELAEHNTSLLALIDSWLHKYLLHHARGIALLKKNPTPTTLEIALELHVIRHVAPQRLKYKPHGQTRNPRQRTIKFTDQAGSSHKQPPPHPAAPAAHSPENQPQSGLVGALAPSSPALQNLMSKLP